VTSATRFRKVDPNGQLIGLEVVVLEVDCARSTGNYKNRIRRLSPRSTQCKSCFRYSHTAKVHQADSLTCKHWLTESIYLPTNSLSTSCANTADLKTLYLAAHGRAGRDTAPAAAAAGSTDCLAAILSAAFARVVLPIRLRASGTKMSSLAAAWVLLFCYFDIHRSQDRISTALLWAQFTHLCMRWAKLRRCHGFNHLLPCTQRHPGHT